MLKQDLCAQAASLASMSFRFLAEIGFEKNASIPEAKAIAYVESSWYALTHAMKGYVCLAYLYSCRMIFTVVGPSCSGIEKSQSTTLNGGSRLLIISCTSLVALRPPSHFSQDMSLICSWASSAVNMNCWSSMMSTFALWVFIPASHSTTSRSSAYDDETEKRPGSWKSCISKDFWALCFEPKIGGSAQILKALEESSSLGDAKLASSRFSHSFLV